MAALWCTVLVVLLPIVTSCIDPGLLFMMKLFRTNFLAAD